MINNLYKIKNRIIQKTDSILNAMKLMDRIDKKLLFVFENEVFLNIISIGDIQRAILKNISLDTPIKNILRSNTKFAFTKESLESIKAKMHEYRIECMPLLDDSNQLVDVYFWEDVFESKTPEVSNAFDLPIVIMAGGKGSRLKPITNILPKALIPIGEKTILERIMDNFLQYKSKRFYLSVNYKADMIRHYFNELNHPQYKIDYFTEDQPLGTAGSLYLLKDKINQTFFVSNCDIIINNDYSEILKYHKDNKNELTIISALRHYPIPYGIIDTGDNGKLIEITEKPELTFQINSGMYILEPHLLNEIPENKFFHITELIENINKRKGRVGVFPVSEKSWTDIGEWDEYLKNK